MEPAIPRKDWGWPFGRVDPATGKPVEREVGPWRMKAFRVLACLRKLRGTVLDPFRHGAERALDRRLLAQYEADVAAVLAGVERDRCSAPACHEPGGRPRPRPPPPTASSGSRSGSRSCRSTA